MLSFDRGVTMRTPPRSSHRPHPWLLFTAVVVLGWLAFGVIDILLFAATVVLGGGRAELTNYTRGYVQFWGTHAVLTPLAVWALSRVPFERGRFWRAAGWFVCILLGYVALHVGQHVAWLIARSPAGETINAQWLLRRNSVIYYETLGVVFVVLGTTGAVNGWVYYLRYRERADAAAELELDRATLRAQLSESRLELLQARLQPHFLFNALHAITGLVDEDPRKAKETIRCLSDLLRRALDETDAPKVTLARELDWLRDYLEIARIRFEDRLSVDIDVAVPLRGALVPNLLLQPIVENAVRHGIARLAGPGRIAIAGRREGDRLTIDVRDNGPGAHDPARLDARSGMGLSNTRLRLATLYGDRASLSTSTPAAGGFAVSITIPFEEREPAMSAPVSEPT